MQTSFVFSLYHRIDNLAQLYVKCDFLSELRIRIKVHMHISECKFSKHPQNNTFSLIYIYTYELIL